MYCVVMENKVCLDSGQCGIDCGKGSYGGSAAQGSLSLSSPSPPSHPPPLLPFPFGSFSPPPPLHPSHPHFPPPPIPPTPPFHPFSWPPALLPPHLPLLIILNIFIFKQNEY